MKILPERKIVIDSTSTKILIEWRHLIRSCNHSTSIKLIQELTTLLSLTASVAVLLFRLNQMLHHALCLSYHSNTQAVLFACLSSGWATTTGRLLDPKVGNSIKCLCQGHSDELPHRESNQGFATFRLLARRLYQLLQP